MSGEVPLAPVGREDIHKLEAALLVNTLFRPEVLEAIRSPEERLTWIDALAVAAGALAREKARMSIREIAEDLGRTEATIRAHLAGKTKAGELIRRTYEEMLRKGGKISYIPLLELPEVKELVAALKELQSTIKVAIDSLSKLLEKLDKFSGTLTVKLSGEEQGI